jgi:LacI family transcriptional regulator
MKDIARAIGVSIGTVDRALHDKPGINRETRERVLRAAADLGYKPNLAARFLKSRRPLRIAVHLPSEIALFWDTLRDGIRQAALPFEPAVEVDFRSYPSLGVGDVPLFEEALARKYHGVIIAPGDPAAIAPSLARAADARMAVACVVTDAPASPRLTAVSADPRTVGAIAGELMARFLPERAGRVAFVTGFLSMQEHAEKRRGFESSLADTGGRLTIASAIEAHDDARIAYRRTLETLDANPDLAGIYVSTVNSMPVLDAVSARGLTGKVIVITTDLFPALADRIRAGDVVATVYQRPHTQGRLALHALHRYLTDGTPPDERTYVVPLVVMRSNLALLLDRIRLTGEVDETAPAVLPRLA